MRAFLGNARIFTSLLLAKVLTNVVLFSLYQYGTTLSRSMSAGGSAGQRRSTMAAAVKHLAAAKVEKIAGVLLYRGERGSAEEAGDGDAVVAHDAGGDLVEAPHAAVGDGGV